MRFRSLWCLSLFVLAGSAFAAPKDAHRCGTKKHWSQARLQPRMPLPREAAPALTLRSPFGEQPNLTLSEHFAFRAGGTAPNPNAVQKLLTALEESYQHEITQMGHPAPFGSQQFYINVYLGNSGSGAPTIDDFAYAYVTLDNGGVPYIVVQPALLAEYNTNNTGFADTTLAHEFYHAVQFGTDAFNTLEGYWFWEATADWISVEVFPEYIDGDAFVPGYLMYPHIALESFDYPDGGELIELHHYGAQIFARYLSEKVADPSLIRDAWAEGGSNETPIEVLERLLAERGEADINQVFVDFAAHNAVLDYERRASYEAWLDSYVSFYPEEDFLIAMVAPPEGMPLTAAPAETLPGKLGYNVIPFTAFSGEATTITVVGDAVGSKLSEAAFQAIVVRRSPLGVRYESLLFEGLTGSATIEGASAEEELFLVVAAQPVSSQNQEVFGYQVSILPPTAFSGGACSVGASGSSSALVWLALVLVGCVVVRRRYFS